jgi:cyclic di-GMP phosphodiesterase Gmr
VLDMSAVAEAIIARTQAMVALVGETGRLLQVNPTIAAALGRDAGSFIGQNAEALVVPRDAIDFRTELRVALRSRAATSCERGLAVGPDTSPRSVAWSISVVAEDPTVLACIGVDVTAARSEFEVLRSRAITDELTGLPNRAGLLEQLAGMAGSGASVVFCDLNGFKAVNDTFGHASGDAVLVQVARRLKRTVRGEDFVARLGGDEFVIVVPPDPNSDFDALARRLMRAMGQPMMLPGPVVVTVGMSIGVAILETGQDPATVLGAADHNMYLMKSRQPTRAMGTQPAAQTDVCASRPDS